MWFTHSAQALLLLASAQTALAGFYGPKDPVVELTPKNFDSVVYASEQPALVEFYAPWCGHCKNLKPEYTKAAKTLKGLATVAAIDCDEDQNKALCAKFGIQGFPTVKLFVPPKRQTGKARKRSDFAIEDYRGAREAKALSQEVLGKLRSYVTTITSKKADAFFGNDGTKVVLVHTEKPKTSGVPNLLKVLSGEYFGSLQFGYAGPKTDIWDRLDVDKRDGTSLVVLPEGSEPVLYEGELKKGPITEFLNQFGERNAAKKKPKSKKSNASSDETAKADAKAGDKAKAKADAKAGDKPKAKADAKAEDKSNAKADAKTEDKTKAKADDKAEAPEKPSSKSKKAKKAKTKTAEPVEKRADSAEDAEEPAAAATAAADEQPEVQEETVAEPQTPSAADTASTSAEPSVEETGDASTDSEEPSSSTTKSKKAKKSKKSKKSKKTAEPAAETTAEEPAEDAAQESPESAIETPADATSDYADMPGVTPFRPSENDGAKLERLLTFEDIVDKCLSLDEICIVMCTSPYGQLPDFRHFNGGRKAMGRDKMKKFRFFYMIDINEELEYVAKELGMAPYPKRESPIPAKNKGPPSWSHEAALVALSGKGQWVANMRGKVDVANVHMFLESLLEGKAETRKLPKRYLLHMPKQDL